MVGDALFERLSLPPDLPGRGIAIEFFDLRSYKKVILLLGELLAYVYRLILNGIGELSHQDRLLRGVDLL
jgi:hypothetical protein